MQDHLDKKPTSAQEQAAIERNLNEECNVKLQRREVIVIHNILSTLQYKLGDAKIVLGIIDKLTPHAAVDTNITPESHEKQLKNHLTLGKKVN